MNSNRSAEITPLIILFNRSIISSLISLEYQAKLDQEVAHQRCDRISQSIKIKTTRYNYFFRLSAKYDVL